MAQHFHQRQWALGVFYCGLLVFGSPMAPGERETHQLYPAVHDRSGKAWDGEGAAFGTDCPIMSSDGRSLFFCGWGRDLVSMQNGQSWGRNGFLVRGNPGLAEGGSNEVVTHSPSGDPANGTQVLPFSNGPAWDVHRNRAQADLSSDGRRVVFATNSNNFLADDPGVEPHKDPNEIPHSIYL